MLFHRIDQAGRELSRPMLADLLRKGSEEGTFDVPDPEAFAEMLLHLRLIFRDVMYQAMLEAERGNVDEAVGMLEERMRLYGIAFDRLQSRAVGETDLLVLDDDEAALALNRRTEFVLFGLLNL